MRPAADRADHATERNRHNPGLEHDPVGDDHHRDDDYPDHNATTTTPTTQTTTTPAASNGGATVSQSADPTGQLKFTKSSLTAKSGKVTIDFTNKSPVPHDMVIQQGSSGSVIGKTPVFSGGSKTFTVTLKPGTYTFYCSVPGHRQAGMQGTLTVS